MNPVVQTPLQAVDELFGIAEVKAGVEPAPAVGAAVVIGILQVNDVRGIGDDRTALPRHRAGWQAQTFGKGRGVFIETIAVAILEQLDATGGDMPGGHAVIGIAGHLGHIHAAVFVEVDAYRIDDIGLTGHQLGPEALGYLKRGQLILGRQSLGQRARRRPIRRIRVDETNHRNKQEEYSQRPGGFRLQSFFDHFEPRSHRGAGSPGCPQDLPCGYEASLIMDDMVGASFSLREFRE